RLPLEFHILGLGVPALWTSLDVASNAIYQSRFGQVGGMERRNQTLLNNLIAKHGQTGAIDIFNDIRWVDDPDTPVTIPADGAFGRRQKGQNPIAALPDQLEGASDTSDSLQEQADAVLSS